MTTTFATTDELIPGPNFNPLVPLYLAGYNDLFLGLDGNLVLSTGLNAVLYSCQNISQTVSGECVLQTTRGIPDFETVWAGTPNLSQWEIALRSALLSVDGVLDIVSVILDRQSDIFSYTVTISTVYGEGAINGLV